MAAQGREGDQGRHLGQAGGGLTIKLLHIRGASKRRGDTLPARLRFVARRGVTLVELMIAMLILTIVCIAWLEIIGIQSARKEARRREAVERLAGMMDAFMYSKKDLRSVDVGSYYFDEKEIATNNNIVIKFASGTQTVRPVFEDGISPIGYQLLVVEDDWVKNNCGWLREEIDCWGTSRRGWLVGRLFEHNKMVSESEKPFFSLPVFLGLK